MSNQANRHAKNNKSFGQIIPKNQEKRRFWKYQKTSKQRQEEIKKNKIEELENLGYTRKEIYEAISAEKR